MKIKFKFFHGSFRRFYVVSSFMVSLGAIMSEKLTLTPNFNEIRFQFRSDSYSCSIPIPFRFRSYSHSGPTFKWNNIPTQNAPKWLTSKVYYTPVVQSLLRFWVLGVELCALNTWLTKCLVHKTQHPKSKPHITRKFSGYWGFDFGSFWSVSFLGIPALGSF